MKKKVLFIVVIVSLQFLTGVYAQHGVITGKVIDAQDGEPLIGAAVQIEGTTIGGTTNIDGGFRIGNLTSGNYSLKVSYISYKTLQQSMIKVEAEKETIVDFRMETADVSLNEVVVIRKANRESENLLLLEQRQALIATQVVGAREMSRKGASNAEAAVAQVSGISKQECEKNVFVRGLGDRYNATVLNGFPIPSEDPEYKNIALEFFAADIIQNIGVNKLFAGSNGSDVGGAVIDITSKVLFGDRALSVNGALGKNLSNAAGSFLALNGGGGYLGFTESAVLPKPDAGSKYIDNYNFSNSLDPNKLQMPLNHSYGISGGKNFYLGDQRNPLSLFVTASYDSKNAYSEETIRNSGSTGEQIDTNMKGKRYSRSISQLLSGNLNLELDKKHSLSYNFLLIHANNQFLGDYAGLNVNLDNDGRDIFLRRQQVNDNLLVVKQIASVWQLNERIKLDAGASYNAVKGMEPDRRINVLVNNAGKYQYVLGNEQKRFFSTLNEQDFNVKTTLSFKLNDKARSDKSLLRIGYTGRFLTDKFEATDYDSNPVSGYFDFDKLKMDEHYNQQNLQTGAFTVEYGYNKYDVSKYIHSGFADVSYQLNPKLTANLGAKLDYAHLLVSYDVNKGGDQGSTDLNPLYFLPSLNLKYDWDSKNIIRMGASKTYTLPQSKEISPYIYIGLNFKSQGNRNLKPSDNYNFDLKWEFYPSASELISLNAFYKHIKNPIVRDDRGGSANLLTYNNISDHATVAGMELETRKNIFSQVNAANERTNKLTVGLNVSYIYSQIKFVKTDNSESESKLEGAAPLIANFDVSHSYSVKDKTFTNSLVLNYFSNRVHTIGVRPLFNNIVEEGVPSMDFVSSAKISKNITLKLKGNNLLNPDFRLTRSGSASASNKLVLSEYKKGINVEFGMTWEL